MDVEQGLCWRCEDKISEKSFPKCSRCNIAEYCGQQCMERDKLRHQVECDMWNRNRQCFVCSKRTNCLSCAACCEIDYCGKKCQKADWKRHKPSCKQVQKAFLDLVNMYRFWSGPTIEYCPEYFGCTIAVDVLKLNVNEANSSEDLGRSLEKDYSVLFADVGDLRNVLLTTASLPKDFTGNVRYTLADISPFVMARNVLFIYMMVTQSSRDAIEETVTNIWYSLQLPDNDFHFLISMLKELVDHDADSLKAKTSDELLLDKENLSKIKEVWKKWLDLQCDISKFDSIDLVGQRTDLFRNGIWSSNSQGASSYCQSVPERHGESTANYFIDGLFLKHDGDGSELQFDNPTLTGPPLPENRGANVNQQFTPETCNFEYCIPPNNFPFRGWDYIRASKMFKNEDSIVDLFHSYITSVVRNAISFIQKHQISCNCFVKECTTLCKDVAIKHDRIMASNVADFIGDKQLLSSMRPLISETNKHAVLIMQTVHWVELIPQANIHSKLTREREDQLVEVARADTGRQDLKQLQPFEYFDNTLLFIRYLRALFTAVTEESDLLSKKVNIQNFPSSGSRVEGFKLRDFTKGLNKVIPFRYRVNARMCNIQSDHLRNLEWYL
ncbi:uncharacterized protein [Antedon mediterranea]|uniref:uncharacterized protein n=1 Tax=Antedon mediterranea TaxID=105859 RepID=UPI003AF543F5